MQATALSASPPSKAQQTTRPPTHLSPRVMVSLLMAEVRFTSLPLSTHFCTYPRTSLLSFLRAAGQQSRQANGRTGQLVGAGCVCWSVGARIGRLPPAADYTDVLPTTYPALQTTPLKPKPLPITPLPCPGPPDHTPPLLLTVTLLPCPCPPT